MKAKVCHIFLACLLLLVKESQPTPLASPGCSSIVPPPNTDGCDGSVSLSLAEFRDRRDNIIKPKLDSIEGNMTAVFNNLAYVNVSTFKAIY